MYLVTPRRPQTSGGDLLAHAARAAVRCVQAFGRAPEWAQAFTQWERSAARKVCLSARPAELHRTRQLAHEEAGEVLCFPPGRRSVAEPELSGLQAHTGGPLRTADVQLAESELPMLVLLVSDGLQLTLGKACAQVAHGALIARQLHRVSAVTAWQDNGCLTAVVLVDQETFERAKSHLVVAAVRDAGATQIVPGTETVLATEPGAELPGWLQAAARSIA